MPSLGADDPSLPGTGISSAAFTTDAAGTYWVIAQAQGDSPGGWARYDDMVLERRRVEGCPSVAGPDVEICQGDVVQVGTGCLPDPHPLENVEYCYSWIPAEGLQGSSEAMPFVFPNITTIYTVRVTNSQGELVVEDQVEVSVLPAPVVEGPETPYSICKPALPGLAEGEPAARAVSDCPNSSATLDAGAGFQSYFWSTGETGQAITVSAEGYYYVTVTNENGCKGYGAFNVIEEYCSEVALSTDEEALCPGGQLTISAPPGYEAYLWSTGEAGASIAVAQEGVYSLEATTPDGCLAYGEVDIGVYSLEITPNRVALCEGESLVLEAGEGQMPYSWSGPQGAIDEEGSSITVNSAGLYSVTVTNAAGCTLSQSVMVNDCCDPRIYFDGQEYRNGETIVFTPQNVMFGIVFLETDENSIIPYFEWAINGKVYRGRQIALRVIDFFPPLTATPYIILAMPASPCSEIRLSVDVSQIDVADYLPPAKMTLHLVDYFGGNPAILNHLPNVIQKAEAIYSGNDIDWINYEMATSNLGISNLPVITDIGVEL